MIHAGVCSVFAKILKEGPMQVQAVVAWAVSELAGNNPKCQDLFAQHNIIRLLVTHLAFETVEEHSKYTITSNKATSIHAVLVATKNSNSNAYLVDVKDEHEKLGRGIAHPTGNQSMHNVVTTTMAMKACTKPKHQHQHSLSHLGTSIKGREAEDPATKANLKAMAARALRHLARGNSAICRSITESRALLCFAVLLEKGSEDVQFNSAMALMEITAMAGLDTDLRRYAFKPNSPACKAVVDQLLRIIEKAESESDLLVPCIKAIGNLAKTFRATEKRMIGPLVRLLDEREAEISREACIALTKFASGENYLHVDHSKAIISAGGARHLVQLVYLGEEIVQVSAILLLCYIALHVPDSQELAKAEVLAVVEWASKQNCMNQNQHEPLLLEAKSRLELYQSRGFH